MNRRGEEHIPSKSGGNIVLDRKSAKLDTYRASTKPMSAASQQGQGVSVAPEADAYLVRFGEILAMDPEVIATVRTSQEDIRYQRLFSHEEALRQLRRAAVLAP